MKIWSAAHASTAHASTRGLHLGLIVSLAVLLWLGAPPKARGNGAPADTITVTRSDDVNRGACAPGDCSLREAVVAANADPALDTVILPAGTYSLTIPGRGEDLAATGDLDIRAPLVLVGAGPGTSIIDAARNDRVLDVITGTLYPELVGVTLLNGDSGSEPGGNVRVRPAAFVWLDNGAITGGRSEIGGGGLAVAEGAQAVLWHVNVANNLVEPGYGELLCSGGGIYNAGTLGMNNSSVLSNTIANGHSPCTNITGGGIENRGQMVISGTTVAYNAAYNFLWVWGPWVKGGGIYSTGVMTVTNSTISGNLASNDSEFYLSAGGGGVSGSGPGLLDNVTITDNSVFSLQMFAWGGGIYAEQGPSGFPAIENTVIAGNHNAAGGQSSGVDCFGVLPSLDYNLIGSTESCTITGTVAHNLYNVDALLGPLQDNGGPTWTHALLPGSPAIAHANNATCSAWDQRGVPRPQGIWCDMGAFEVRMDYRSFYPFTSGGQPSRDR